jgi:mannosyltransferase
VRIARRIDRFLGPALWAALLVWAGWLRFGGMGEGSFWGDEIRLVSLARRPVLDVWRRTVFPPVHLLVLRAASLAGESELASRFPSALAGVLGVLAVMMVARRGLGAGAELPAGILLTLNPFHLAASREAKYFPLVVLLTALAFLALLQTRRRPRWVWVFAATSILNMYTHTYAVLTAVCQVPLATWAVWRHVRKSPWLLAAPALVLVAILPLSVRAFETATVGAGSAIGDTPFEPLSLAYYARLLATFGPGPRVLPAVLLLLVGIPALKRTRYVAAVAAASIGGPIALTALVRPPIYVDRYLAPMLPSLVVWMTAALVWMTQPLSRFPAARTAAAALLAVLLVPVSGGVGVPPEKLGSSDEDWKGAAGFLRQHAVPGDAVVVAQERKGWKVLLQYYMGDLEGVRVLSAQELPGWAARVESVGARWWVMRGADELAPRMRQVLDSSFGLRTFAGLIVASRSGSCTPAQLCSETAWVMQARLLLPMVHWVRPAHYAVVGDLYFGAGDTSRAAIFYRRALALDPSLARALGGIRRVDRGG